MAQGGIYVGKNLIPWSAFFNSGGGGAAAFDAADNYGARGYILFPELDTRKEIDHYNRTAILKKSRWLYNNVGTAKRIVRGLSREIGFLTPRPNTPDPKWNLLAKKYFEAKTGTGTAFDVSGKYSFPRYQVLLNRLWLRDGDSLTAFVTDGPNARVKCFEGHQVGELARDRFNALPTARARDRARRRWFDGVLVDDDNRHLAYSVIDSDDPTTGTILTADKARLHTLFERPGQPRGIGALHGAINHILDATETLSFIKSGIKTANLVGFYLHRDVESTTPVPGGGLARRARHELASRAADAADSPSGDTTTEAAEDELLAVEDVVGSGVVMDDLAPGTEPRILHDPRPHQNQMDALKFIIREAVNSLDFPPDLIFEIANLNGNVVRVLNEQAESSLDDHRDELNLPFCQRVWFAIIGHGIATGELPEPAIPAELAGLVGWWTVEWSKPRRRTIDRGREGRLHMEERSRMMRSLSRHFADTYATDWRDEVREFMDEIQEILDDAEARGWPEDRIRALEAMLLSAPAGTALSVAAEEMEKTDPKKPAKP